MGTTMRQSFLNWYRRYFSNPEAVTLILLLLAGAVLVYLSIGVLMPVFAAILIAYVLDGAVKRLQGLSMGRLPAVIVVFCLFMAFSLAMFMIFIPLLYREGALLVRELPSMVAFLREWIQDLSREYPEVISPERIAQVQDIVSSKFTRIGEFLIQVSVNSVMSIITIAIYLVLVPFLTFFFLKDKERILAWIRSILPRSSGLSVSVWNQANVRFSDYIRGKVWEILIEWGITYLGFLVLGLNYALLLSFFVGLSVLIPYIGVILAALPAFSVALLQWGAGAEIVYLLILFAIIQIISSNIISPLLFSEMVKLHPVVITIALLVFGELWGIWGLIFAIPLATLIQAVVVALVASVSGKAAAPREP